MLALLLALLHEYPWAAATAVVPGWVCWRWGRQWPVLARLIFRWQLGSFAVAVVNRKLGACVLVHRGLPWTPTRTRPEPSKQELSL